MSFRTFAAALAFSTASFATPLQAAVRLDQSALYFSTTGGVEDSMPGLGTVTRVFGFSDIGGCEDEQEGPCGGYENGRFRLTLADGGMDYAASIFQSQSISFNDPDTMIDVYAVFRAARPMRTSLVEQRLVNVLRCAGGCPSTLQSRIEQTRLGDGSWELTVNLATYAAVHEAAQTVDHRFRLAVAEVPEPGSWAMLIAGFGLVGAAARYRRRLRPAA